MENEEPKDDDHPNEEDLAAAERMYEENAKEIQSFKELMLRGQAMLATGEQSNVLWDEFRMIVFFRFSKCDHEGVVPDPSTALRMTTLFFASPSLRILELNPVPQLNRVR